MPEAIARHKETKNFVQTVTVYETLFSFLKTMLQKAFLAMKKFALLRYARNATSPITDVLRFGTLHRTVLSLIYILQAKVMITRFFI